MIKIELTKEQALKVIGAIPLCSNRPGVGQSSNTLTQKELKELNEKLIKLYVLNFEAKTVELTLTKKEFEIVNKAIIEFVKGMARQKALVDREYEDVNKLYDKIIRADMEQNR